MLVGKSLRYLVLAFGAAASTAICAQEWPAQKPLQFVVAFAPASSTDIVARLVAQKLTEAVGQSVVVENRPGAGGNIGAQYVKRAAPEGYTLLVISVSFAVNPNLYANAGYDPIADFAPVILGPSTPNIITVHPSVAANNIRELVELARREKLAYASSGIGTTTHLSMERLKAATGVDITHVPYQPAQAVGAVVAGHTQISSTSMPPAIPQVKAGKLRAMATASAKRARGLPEVPTFAELGYADFEVDANYGLIAPAGTPRDIVAKLSAGVAKAAQSADLKERYAGLGLEPLSSTPEQYAEFIRRDIAKWRKVVAAAKLKPQ